MNRSILFNNNYLFAYVRGIHSRAGSAVQLSVRDYKFKLGAILFAVVRVETIAPDVEKFRFAITYDYGRTIQIGVFQLVSRLTTE